MWGELAESMRQGNNYINVMLFLGFIGTTILVERLFMLLFVYNINNRKFVTELKKMINAGDNERGMNFCKTVSSTGIPYIALKSLEANAQDPLTVKGCLEECTIEFLPKVEARINLIPALATVVLLVGVLATIDGMWASFNSLDVLDTAKKQAILGKGIASSLAPTSLGLLISMILLAGSQIIRGMAISVTEKIHHGVSALGNLLIPSQATVVQALPAMMSRQQISAQMAESTLENALGPLGEEHALNDARIEDIKDEEEII